MNARTLSVRLSSIMMLIILTLVLRGNVSAQIYDPTLGSLTNWVNATMDIKESRSKGKARRKPAARKRIVRKRGAAGRVKTSASKRPA
jgi:hypothetical protein